MPDKTFDCPFCGKKDAFHDSEDWSISYCNKCKKLVIVLTMKGPIQKLPDNYRRIIHEIFCEPSRE